MGEERSEEESVECMRRLDMVLSVRRERCAMRHSESVAGETTRWRAMRDEGWGCRKELMVVVVFSCPHCFAGWFWNCFVALLCFTVVIGTISVAFTYGSGEGGFSTFVRFIRLY